MRRNTPLQMTPDEFRAAGHRLVDQIANRLGRIPQGPVTPAESVEAVRAAFNTSRALPERGSDPQALLADAAELLFDHSLLNGHPRFFGYITSSPAPIGILGDLIASAVNSNLGGWAIAPAGTEVELQTVRWIAEFIGYPADSGGLLVSGGNMANFVCFLAARTAKANWDVRKSGLRGDGKNDTPRLTVFASAETHTWIQKAADLFGLGTDAIRWIPVDAHQRMKTADLRRQIDEDRARGDRPFLVVGTAGSVSTGAVDPLPEIAEICRELDLWFHVDGAYGALAAPIPDAPDDLRGLAMADSVAVDPHKWLYAPLEAGCALVRRPEHMTNAFSYHPPYYQLKSEVVNFVDYGLQNSRGFRALKVWLALQHVGRAGYEASIAEDMRLSRRLATLLREHGDFEVLSQGLSITTFRYIPRELRRSMDDPANETLNRVNRELLQRVEKSGEAFFSNAVIDGKFALRACIVNFNTAEQDIDAMPALLARHAAALKEREPTRQG
jgi:glutamate/tyrosine decarboxylase-like PLP-dependent enzyme